MDFKWIMETTNGLIFNFHTTTHDDGPSPLDTIDDYNQGDSWRIYGGSNKALFSAFDIDKNDNLFILVPKKDVLKIWTVPANIKRFS